MKVVQIEDELNWKLRQLALREKVTTRALVTKLLSEGIKGWGGKVVGGDGHPTLDIPREEPPMESAAFKVDDFLPGDDDVFGDEASAPKDPVYESDEYSQVRPSRGKK